MSTTLGELIDTLKRYPEDQVVPLGFSNAHSYRGYYDQLAFEPATNTTVGTMLREAEYAVGGTFQGWKGGEYTMGLSTDVHLANEGDCGEEIGPILLRLMLGEPPIPPEPGPWSVVRKDGNAWVRNGESPDSPWSSKDSYAKWEKFLYDAEILHLEPSA